MDCEPILLPTSFTSKEFFLLFKKEKRREGIEVVEERDKDCQTSTRYSFLTQIQYISKKHFVELSFAVQRTANQQVSLQKDFFSCSRRRKEGLNRATKIRNARRHPPDIYSIYMRTDQFSYPKEKDFASLVQEVGREGKGREWVESCRNRGKAK